MEIESQLRAKLLLTCRPLLLAGQQAFPAPPLELQAPMHRRLPQHEQQAPIISRRLCATAFALSTKRSMRWRRRCRCRRLQRPATAVERAASPTLQLETSRARIRRPLLLSLKLLRLLAQLQYWAKSLNQSEQSSRQPQILLLPRLAPAARRGIGRLQLLG